MLRIAKLCAVLLLASGACLADPLTLKDAVARALANAPELTVVLAQQQKAREAWREARAQFIPSVTVGSGLAGTHGFPMSIEGAAPSIFQIVSNSMLYNRPQREAIHEAQHMWRATEQAGTARAEEIAWRTAATYLELNKAQRSVEVARREVQSSARMEAETNAQVSEGREIPLEGLKARLVTARQRQLVTDIETQVEQLQTALRALTGLPADHPIEAVESTLPPDVVALSSPRVDEILQRAYDSNPDLKRLALEVQARESHVRSEKAQRLPQFDLVGQYAMFTKLNNYEDFFARFERNNFELGFAARLNIFDGHRVSARVGQAQADLAQARATLQIARNEVTSEVRRAYAVAHQLESAQQVAKLDLDVARESVNIALARYQEGRISDAELERARLEESGKWMAFLDSNYALERARLDLLRQTGQLSAALR